MEINRFKNIVKDIKDNFILSKKIINEIIEQEIDNGCMISFDNCLKYMDIALNDIIENKIKEEKEQKIGLVYNGNPEVLINVIITSIYFNNKVCFYAESYKIFQAAFVELINKVLEEYNIKEKFVVIDESRDGSMIYNQNKYTKIIYVGDYFECENIEYYISKSVAYSSYTFLKVYIDKLKYKNEYKDLMKYTYKNNISVEYYNDLDEFIENVEKKDTVIIYCEDEEIEEISKKIKTKKIYTKDNFYENYRFSYVS